MEQKTGFPATPAQAATPGSSENGQGSTPATSAQTPDSGTQGGSQTGVVTITTEEFRKLSRNSARWESSNKKGPLGSSQRIAGVNPATPQFNPQGQSQFDGMSPETIEIIQTSQSERDSANQRAFEAELKVNVRDIFDKEDFKNIPISVKKMILKNPSAYTNAKDAVEAAEDIENYLYDEIIPDITPSSSGTSAPEVKQTGEVPPVVNQGAPSPVQAGVVEDTRNLTGQARSRGMIRNIMRQGK